MMTWTGIAVAAVWFASGSIFPAGISFWGDDDGREVVWGLLQGRERQAESERELAQTIEGLQGDAAALKAEQAVEGQVGPKVISFGCGARPVPWLARNGMTIGTYIGQLKELVPPSYEGYVGIDVEDLRLEQETYDAVREAFPKATLLWYAFDPQAFPEGAKNIWIPVAPDDAPRFFKTPNDAAAARGLTRHVTVQWRKFNAGEDRYRAWTDQELRDCVDRVLEARPYSIGVWADPDYEWRLYQKGDEMVKRTVDKERRGVNPREYIFSYANHVEAVVRSRVEGTWEKEGRGAPPLLEMRRSQFSSGRRWIPGISVDGMPSGSTLQYTVTRMPGVGVRMVVENKNIMNTKPGGRGISIEGSGYVIDELVVRNCTVRSSDYCLWVGGVVRKLVVEDSHLEAKAGADNYAIRCYAEKVELRRSTIANPASEGKANLRVMSCKDFVAEGCRFTGNRILLGAGAGETDKGPFEFFGRFERCEIDADSVEVFPGCIATFTECDFGGTDRLVPWDESKLLGRNNSHIPWVKANETATVDLEREEAGTRPTEVDDSIAPGMKE